MTRTEFTANVTKLLHHMITDGLRPALDWVKRSTEEQQKLFKEGKSKLDGVHKRSAHQSGKAVDILLFDSAGVLIDHWPEDVAKKFHSWWEAWGGKPMISWDVGHFEG